jgi:hypothetical protein
MTTPRSLGRASLLTPAPLALDTRPLVTLGPCLAPSGSASASQWLKQFTMKRKTKLAKERARLEPRKDFDKAIVGKMPNGMLIYSFHDLVKILLNTNKTWDEDMARDWIDFNIACLPLVINYYE